MADQELTVTVMQTDNGVRADLWCPAYVDMHEADTAQDALAWARSRIEAGGDPFAEYHDT